ncbi:MAG: hypothetical protein KC414_12210, partial [Romboutsia sp.]|nr:hypothetical protein [Romboutsia sp.]
MSDNFNFFKANLYEFAISSLGPFFNYAEVAADKIISKPRFLRKEDILSQNSQARLEIAMAALFSVGAANFSYSYTRSA